jgi:formiminoglutamase
MLDHWLKPVDLTSLFSTKMADYQFGKKMDIYSQKLPDLTKTRAAIIGMNAAATNAVRRALYRMSVPNANPAIADLGNVRKEDTAFAIPLFKELLDSQIIPIIIGAEGSQMLTQYKAFQSLQSHVSLVVVDERIRLNEKDKKGEAHYLNQIVFSSRSRLYHLGVVGCQTHYTDPAVFDLLNQQNFDSIRLGSARADLQEVEPIVRDGDLLGFHLSALKQADAPGQAQATPTGFTAEEACQIARYAGMSDKLKSYGIFGFQPERDRDAQTAQVVAQMVWYFIEGLHNRKNDFPVSTDGLVEYIVDFKQMEYQLTFWKSQRSGRWWMQVPVKIGKKYNRHRLIPCSYNDYKLACQDELPERLLNAYKRFL